MRSPHLLLRRGGRVTLVQQRWPTAPLMHPSLLPPLREVVSTGQPTRQRLNCLAHISVRWDCMAGSHQGMRIQGWVSLPGWALHASPCSIPPSVHRSERAPLLQGWWRSKLAGTWELESLCERRPELVIEGEVNCLCGRPPALLVCLLQNLLNPYLESYLLEAPHLEYGNCMMWEFW